MIIFHHPARARIKRTKWIQIKYICYKIYPYPHIYELFYVRIDLLDSIFQSYNYPLQRIKFLQINAQDPSRLTKLIMIKEVLSGSSQTL